MPAPNITPLPSAPSRSQSPDTFSTDADAFLGALPDFGTEANAQADYLDGLADQVTIDAATAAYSASAAAGAANYQGDYSAGTTYQIGECVSYSGRRYVAKTVNTGVTPVDGANWFLINDGDVLGPASATNNALALFDGTTGKIIKSGLGNGTAGQVLTSGGSGNIPAWASPSGADLPRVTRTSNIEITSADKGKMIEYTANTFTQTFAAASALRNGWWCYLHNKTVPAFESTSGFTNAYTPLVNSSTWSDFGSVTSVFMHPDGTYLYYIHSNDTNRGRVLRFAIPIPFDISSITSTQTPDQTFNADAQILPYGKNIFFKSDGTQMFLFAMPSSQMIVYVYNLSTPWSISSASYSGTSFTFDLTGGPFSAIMSNDGTKVYVANSTTVRQYNLGTAWSFNSVTTGSNLSINNANGGGPSNVGVGINSNGTSLFLRAYKRFHEWKLPTPYSLTGATYYGVMSANNSKNDDNIISFFGMSQDRMFVANATRKLIYQYSLDKNLSLYTPMESQSSRDVVLDPNGAETIDGLTSFTMYPGEMRLVYCDGTALYSVPLKPFQRMYQASGNFMPPPGYTAYQLMAWSAGAGGGAGYYDGTSTYRGGNGGGGGACLQRIVPSSIFTSTNQRIIIGAGGAGATNYIATGTTATKGGTTYIGNVLGVYGGNASVGGGYFSFTEIPSSGTSQYYDGTFGGGRGSDSNSNGYASIYGGGGGGTGGATGGESRPANGGNSIYGGGGGGGGQYTAGDGYGGNGGGLVYISASTTDTTARAGAGGVGALSDRDGRQVPGATLLPFGHGGGGGAPSDAALYRTGINGGIAGGGGGGGPYYTTIGSGAGGNGGNGFAIIQGIL